MHMSTAEIYICLPITAVLDAVPCHIRQETGNPSKGCQLTLWHCRCQGQILEELDYDTVHEMSLLIDAGGRRRGLRRLGRALGVSPEVLANVCGFQELFQYLSTSTSTLLPQLAEAIASLPRPDLVARMHQCLLARHSLQPQGVQDGGSPPPRDGGVLEPSALTRQPDT